MEAIRSWQRLHINGVMAVVDELRLETGGILYAAGALSADDVGELDTKPRNLREAQTSADAQARRDGHDCRDGCDLWVEVPP